jgi:hypothetical protein
MALPNRPIPTPEQIAQAQAVLEQNIVERKQKMEEAGVPPAAGESEEANKPKV